MSYKKGDVRFSPTGCEKDEDGYCDNDEHSHPTDARDDEYFEHDGVAYLPHSCQEWVIGTKEQAQRLIDDLRAWVDGKF